MESQKERDSKMQMANQNAAVQMRDQDIRQQDNLATQENARDNTAVQKQYADTNQSKFDLEKLKYEIEENRKKRMAESAKGGIDGIRDFLVAEGDAESALKIMKSQSELQNSLYQGRKSALELDTDEAKLKAFKKADILSDYATPLLSLDDPKQRQQMAGMVIEKLASEGIVDMRQSFADNPDLATTVLTQQAVSNDKFWQDVLKNKDMAGNLGKFYQAIKSGNPLEQLDAKPAEKTTNEESLYKYAKSIEESDPEGYKQMMAIIDKKGKSGGSGASNGASITLPDGTTVVTGGKPTQNKIEKDIMDSENSLNQLDRIQEDINNNVDLLRPLERAYTGVSKFKDVVNIATPEDKKRVAAFNNLQQNMKVGLQKYVLTQAGTTFTDKLMESLKEQYIDPDSWSPETVKSQIGVLFDIAREDNAMFKRWRAEGLSIDQINNKAAKIYKLRELEMEAAKKEGN